MSETRWVARVRALIADDDGRVLVLEQDGRTLLPSVEIEGTDDELNELGRAALAALTGFGTVVVRSLVRSVDGEQKVAELGLELEPVADAVVAGGRSRLANEDRSSLAPSSRTTTARSSASDSADRPPPERPRLDAARLLRRGIGVDRRRAGLAADASESARWSRSRTGASRRSCATETEAGRVYFKATAARRSSSTRAP